jgi:hypothetical protein
MAPRSLRNGDAAFSENLDEAEVLLILNDEDLALLDPAHNLGTQPALPLLFFKAPQITQNPHHVAASLTKRWDAAVSIDRARTSIVSGDDPFQRIAMPAVFVHQDAQVAGSGVDILLRNTWVGAVFHGGAWHQLHEADRALRGDSVTIEIRFRRDDAPYERGRNVVLLRRRPNKRIGIHRLRQRQLFLQR